MRRISPEHQEQKRQITREAAVSLVEDLAHIREVLGRPGRNRGEVRRIAAIVRRMLLDGDLNMVAAPRIGRVLIEAPDNKPYYVDNRTNPYLFFCSGGVTMLGVTFWAICRRREGRYLPDAGPEKTIQLRIDNFIAQRVICMKNCWFTRKEVIRHIAHYGSGVHSQAPDPKDELLVRARGYVAFGLNKRAQGVNFFDKALLPEPPKFSVDPNTIDCLLMEVLAAAMLVAQAPDVLKLEAAIRDECGL